MTQELTVQNNSIFKANNFSEAKDMATYLSGSDLVPEAYRTNEKNGDKSANIVLALEMAERTKTSPFAVMQNMHVISGKPAWSSQFIISMINSCGRFTPLKYKFETEEEVRTFERTYYWNKQKKSETKQINNVTCYAYATEIETGDLIVGPKVSLEMAFLEGWYSKPGSKWPTMPQMMLQYRAASFFGRFNCPEMLMGMQSENEVNDVQSVQDENTIITPSKTSTDDIIQELDDELEADIIEVDTVTENVAETIKKEEAEAVEKKLDEKVIEELEQEKPIETEPIETETDDLPFD